MTMSNNNNKIMFFSGTPLLRVALVRRATVVAKNLLKAGYDVTLSSVASNYYELEQKNIFYEDCKLLFFGQGHFTERGEKKTQLNSLRYIIESFKTVSRFKKYIADNDINSVVIFTTLPVSLLLALCLNKKKFKLYYDIDDLAASQMPSTSLLNKVVKPFLSFAERFIPGIASKISTCSYFLQKYYPGSVVIPNMVELEYFKNIDLQKKLSLLKNNTLEVILLSEMSEYHGHIDLINSIKNREQDLIGKFHFNFLGGGSGVIHIREYIKKMNLDKLVTIPGRVEFKGVIQYLDKSSIGIIPMASKPVNEARNPLKMLEYMLSYTLIISNPTGEIVRYVKNNETGYLTADNTTDSIIEILIGFYKNRAGVEKMLSNAYLLGLEYGSVKQ